jgi:serine phosphatase RsbU (regulator of sigma subunit)
VKAGKIKELKANNMRGGCGEEGDCMFATGTIKVEPGDILYLFSDGFADQFGGKYHKKYQRSRFMEFLGSIRKHSMPEQSDLLYEEFERWREENNEDQTDDIMVIGIRL